MPTYDFTCTDCGHATEVRATFSEKDAGLSPRCATCGGDDLRRLFRPVSVMGSRMPAPAPAGGGGCCGGGCCG